MGQYKRILVAVDGSKASELALKKSIILARTYQSELFIAHVIDTRAFQSLSYYDDETADQATAMAEQTLAEYKQLAQLNDVAKVTTILRYGIPKKILAQQLPQELSLDAILIGSDQRTFSERLLLGSVSKYLRKHSPTELIVVN